MLREAGLPVNAGFSRPASFTVAALGMQHPAAQLAPLNGGGYSMPVVPQAPWAAPPGSWVPPPLPPPGALPQGEPAAWQGQQLAAQPIQQQQQQQPYWRNASQLQLPPPQPAAPQPWLESAAPWQGQPAISSSPPSALLMQQQQQLLLQSAAACCRASSSLPASPGRASPLRARSARPLSAAPPASFDAAASVRRSGSAGTLAAAALTNSTELPLQVRLASISASCSLSQAAEEQLERQQQQRLLKLDSDLVASASWRAGRDPAAKEPAALPAVGSGEAAAQPSHPTSTAEEAAVTAGSLQRSPTGGSSGSSSLASSALQALVAAAEAEDVPRMESEAWEEACEARPTTSQPEAVGAISASASLAAQDVDQPSSTAGAPPASTAAQLKQPRSNSPALPPASPTADDPLAAAAAALARFEQLQSQLQQLQAGLAVPPLRPTADVSPVQQPLLEATAQPAEEAASPVAKVMRQAESFLEQAQQLLQRLNLATASPQQQQQHAATAPLTGEPAASSAVQQAEQPMQHSQPQQASGGSSCHSVAGGSATAAAAAAAAAISAPVSVQSPPQPELHTAAWQLPGAELPAAAKAEPGCQEGSAGASGCVPWQTLQADVQPGQAWPAAHPLQQHQPAWVGGQQRYQPAAAQQQQHVPWEAAQLPQQLQPLTWQAQDQAFYEQPSQAWLQPEACNSYAGLHAEQSAAYLQPSQDQAGWQGSERQEQQLLAWGRRQRWEAGHGQRGRQAAWPAGGYAQRRQAAASAAGSRPGSAQQRLPERAGGQMEQGSYLQVARVAKVRDLTAGSSA